MVFMKAATPEILLLVTNHFVLRPALNYTRQRGVEDCVKLHSRAYAT